MIFSIAEQRAKKCNSLRWIIYYLFLQALEKAGVYLGFPADLPRQ